MDVLAILEAEIVGSTVTGNCQLLSIILPYCLLLLLS